MPPQDNANPLEYAELTRQLRQQIWTRRLKRISAVIAILVAIISVPALMYMRARAEQGLCVANLKSIGQCMILYMSENSGALPPDLITLASSQMITPSVFVCFSSSDTPAKGATPQLELAEMAKPGHVSYIYTHPRQPITFQTPEDLVLLYDPTPHLGKTNVLLVGGYVMQLNAAETKQFMANLAAGNPRFSPPLDPPATQP